MSDNQPPFILAVAPNGARKTKADHPALPMTPAEIARTAAECREAGAAMIHLHVRDSKGRHSLDTEHYRAAIHAVQDEVGDDLVIQVTSEAVGIYQPIQQMEMVRDLKPEAVSLAVRELVPDAASESTAAEFFAWAVQERISLQFILYSPEDLTRFNDLVARGIVPGERQCVLFVLGRYAKDQRSSPVDLLPFLRGEHDDHLWFICAFGPQETACAVAGAVMGGHARVGFENNFALPSGEIAANNAELVNVTSAAVQTLGRRVASPQEARALLST